MKTMRLPPLPTIKDVIRIYNLRAQKQLSQNFLLNPILLKKFVKVAGNLDDAYVCEVGPGPGGITRTILETGVKQVTVIEKDRRFIPSLEILKEASCGKVQIYLGDVMQFDMAEVFPDSEIKEWSDKTPNIQIIGNLPFNVSTPLIIRWLHNISEHNSAWRFGRTQMTLTFQKEVAQRIVAPINNDQRSRISVMCQNYCHVKHVFDINGRAFLPPPDVDAGVVHFTPRVKPIIHLPFKLVEKVIRHTFHYRPKKCKRGVATLFPPDEPEITTRMFVKTDISPDTRPYQLTIEEFKRLCHEYNKIIAERPELFTYDYRSKENAPAWRYPKPLQV